MQREVRTTTQTVKRLNLLELNLIGPNLLGAAVLGLAVLLSAPASARDSDNAGRYTMHPADNGFIRLDTITGAVAHCNQDEDKWKCEPVEGARASDREEIARLRQENKLLKGDVTRLEGMIGIKPPGTGQRPDPPAPGGKQHSFRLPNEKQVDQAFDYFENMLRKLQERLKRLERNQSPEPKQL